jgi:lipopolysaccharide transport system permease protein
LPPIRQVITRILRHRGTCPHCRRNERLVRLLDEVFGIGIVKYRDIRYVIPFLVHFGLYISPVGFGSSVVPEEWRLSYPINPMVGVVDGFRWCILGGQSPVYLPGLAASLCVAVFFLWFGIHRFRKTERTFADLI